MRTLERKETNVHGIYSLFTITKSMVFKKTKNLYQLKLAQTLYQNILYKKIAGGARRDRTDDLRLAKPALSQLSYGPQGQQLSKSII
tara:strand:- start:38 stop:298 length:261 start_codon:yes stop_codon:yes gene_type:complete